MKLTKKQRRLFDTICDSSNVFEIRSGRGSAHKWRILKSLKKKGLVTYDVGEKWVEFFDRSGCTWRNIYCFVASNFQLLSLGRALYAERLLLSYDGVPVQDS
jgi:hypothetical protein